MKTYEKQIHAVVCSYTEDSDGCTSETRGQPALRFLSALDQPPYSLSQHPLGFTLPKASRDVH